MKLYLVPACLVATAALCTGCSPMHSTEMGAGPSPSTGTMCKDGSVQPADSTCMEHGGVQRSRSPSTPRESSY